MDLKNIRKSISDERSELSSDKNHKFIINLKFNTDNIIVNACYNEETFLHIFEEKFTLEAIHSSFPFFKDDKCLNEVYFKLKNLIANRQFKLLEETDKIQIEFLDADGLTLKIIKKEDVKINSDSKEIKPKNGIDISQIKEEDKITINYIDRYDYDCDKEKQSLICDKNISFGELYELIVSERTKIMDKYEEENKKKEKNNKFLVFCGEKINPETKLNNYNENLYKDEIVYVGAYMKMINIKYENTVQTYYVEQLILSEIKHYLSIKLNKPGKNLILLKNGKEDEKFTSSICMHCFMSNCEFILVKVFSNDDFKIKINKIYDEEKEGILFNKELTINKTLSKEDVLTLLAKDLNKNYNKYFNKDDYQILFFRYDLSFVSSLPADFDEIFPGDEFDIRFIYSTKKIKNIIKSEEAFKIEIKALTGMEFFLDVSENLSIFNLKILIEEIINIPIFDQRLILKGKQLENHFTIRHYNLKEGSLLHLARYYR